jgi:hypothetical protein
MPDGKAPDRPFPTIPSVDKPAFAVFGLIAGQAACYQKDLYLTEEKSCGSPLSARVISA